MQGPVPLTLGTVAGAPRFCQASAEEPHALLGDCQSTRAPHLTPPGLQTKGHGAPQSETLPLTELNSITAQKVTAPTVTFKNNNNRLCSGHRSDISSRGVFC